MVMVRLKPVLVTECFQGYLETELQSSGLNETAVVLIHKFPSMIMPTDVGEENEESTDDHSSLSLSR